MKKILTTIFACLAILGFSAALEGSSYGGGGDSGQGYYRYTRYRDSGYRDYRYYGKHDRRILKKIRKNERRIRKLERKIRKLSRRRYYRGDYRSRKNYRKIRRYEREIDRLIRMNRHMRRRLRR